MIRAVLDANIIVSGLFWSGPPRATFEAALSKQYMPLDPGQFLLRLAEP